MKETLKMNPTAKISKQNGRRFSFDFWVTYRALVMVGSFLQEHGLFYLQMICVLVHVCGCFLGEPLPSEIAWASPHTCAVTKCPHHLWQSSAQRCFLHVYILPTFPSLGQKYIELHIFKCKFLDLNISMYSANWIKLFEGKWMQYMLSWFPQWYSAICISESSVYFWEL